MEFMDLAAARYSVRSFRPEPVTLLVAGYPAEDAKPLPLHFETRPIGEIVEYV